MNSIFNENTPFNFWRTVPEYSSDVWLKAAKAAVHYLPNGSEAFLSDGWASLNEYILGEGQFGPDHWELKPILRLYYRFRPILPTALRPLLRQISARSRRQVDSFLGWPIEGRYARFMFGTLECLLEGENIDSMHYIHFWPNDKQFAFILTHDIESMQGVNFVRTIVELEEKFGFRSSFNFVPELYPIDRKLFTELRERGFEVGLHGLKHDGRMFSSQATFLSQAERINTYLRDWGISGFRSPLTHRQPHWMQALEIGYDTSFFDTDPYEPIAGGTMCIWPFFMGRFIELPYTLEQDHTLIQTLGETTPRIWLEKVEFLRRFNGMALINTHPDYLINPDNLSIYEEFLYNMSLSNDYWHALPEQVATWWRNRVAAKITREGKSWQISGLPEGRISAFSVADLRAINNTL